MEEVFNTITQTLSSLWALGGLIAIGFGIYWLLGKRARQKQIAELRRRHEQMLPTDPQYNTVKSLLAAMIADSQMHTMFSFFGSDSGANHDSSADYSGSDGGDSGGDGGGD